MDSQIVVGIVSARVLVDEGQLIKVKGRQLAEGYYQLEVAQRLLPVVRPGYADGLISAILPCEPTIHPGTEVRFIPRQPEPGVIQGPVVHAFLAGEAGCALQIANFGEVPQDFGEGRFELEVQRLNGSLRLPVLKQSFQYSFSGSELLTVVLGSARLPEEFPAGSWAVLVSV